LLAAVLVLGAASVAAAALWVIGAPPPRVTNQALQASIPVPQRELIDGGTVALAATRTARTRPALNGGDCLPERRAAERADREDLERAQPSSISRFDLIIATRSAGA
jgi:hypothetical protein